ncbi:MAG TPA: sigma-70 family RNA polymerase sigma factor [Planctomycetaceae bacterium]|nr:sigma-70 family RNA polymerase sigma factor [Planctomycetaceae bacterium]
MSMHVVLEGFDDRSLRSKVELYWQEKAHRIERFLKGYPSDVYELRLTIHASHKGEHNWWYEARGVVRLPTGTLVAHREGEDPIALIDQIVDNLVRQIKRHRELVRKDYLYKRKSRAKRDLVAAEPLLAQDKSRGRQRDFFRLLRPLLNFLADHARRELRILEIEGVIHPREVSVADLLDEVLNRAWRQYPKRPDRLPLYVWLTQLLHDVIEDWVRQEPRPHVSLQTRVLEGVQDLPVHEIQVGEDEWWAALLGYSETLTLEDLVPGCDPTLRWDELEPSEQREQILQLVRRLPRPQRQALLLSAVEDLDLAEIAMLQGRPEEEVRQDIDHARRQLRQWLEERQQIEPATRDDGSLESNVSSSKFGELG